MCPDLSVPKVTCNTLLDARGTRLPSPPGGGRRSLPLGLRSGLREPDKTVQKLTILIDDRLNSFNYDYEEEDFWQISTLSGYFSSRWWMMLVVSLNQMPSMLSRTNGTWRRVAMSNQGHSHLNLNLALEITNPHLRSASLLFQSTQLS